MGDNKLKGEQQWAKSGDGASEADSVVLWKSRQAQKAPRRCWRVRSVCVEVKKPLVENVSCCSGSSGRSVSWKVSTTGRETDVSPSLHSADDLQWISVRADFFIYENIKETS